MARARSLLRRLHEARSNLSTSAPPGGHRRIFSSGAFVIVGALAFLATGLALYHEHTRTLADVATTAARLSEHLEEQTRRDVQAVDLTLTGIVDTILLAHSLRPHDVVFEEALKRWRDRLPFIRALLVIGADGLINQHTGSAYPPGVSLADRGYFQVHLHDPAVGLYIGPPLRSRSVAREWFISMSRRLKSPTGRFDGIVLAVVEPRYFEASYEKLSLLGGDSIALFHQNGLLYWRTPFLERRIGELFVHIPLFQRELPARRSGVYRSSSDVDGVQRTIGYRSVEGLPLVVAVGLVEDARLAAWRRMALGAIAALMLLLALCAVVLAQVVERVRQRQALGKHLDEAQKLEALGRMTGEIAHDFNNVLNVVATNLYVIQKTSHPVPAQVDPALRAVKQGTHIASQLLLFARRQELAVQPVEINQLVFELMPLLRQAGGASVDFSTSLADDLWPCFANDGQLKSAILNLVINARDAMPQGKGRIGLSTENCSLTAKPPKNAGVRGDFVRVTICDNGSGMPPHVLRRATEPFYTTKPRGVGTGLGLSQIQGFIQQVGGELRIDSTIGIGTSVHLYFRRATRAPEVSGATA